MSRTVTAGVRVPIVITTEAVGLQRSLQQLGATLRRAGTSITSDIGGMLAGWIGVQGALRGLQLIRDEAERLQGLAVRFSPQASAADAFKQTAELKRDIAVGQAVTPIAAERSRREAARAATEMTPAAISEARDTARLGLAMEDMWQGVKDKGIAVWNALNLNFEAAAERMALGEMRMQRSLDLEIGSFAVAGRQIEEEALRNTTLEQIAQNSRETARNTMGRP
jgi:hypothetical protein